MTGRRAALAMLAALALLVVPACDNAKEPAYQGWIEAELIFVGPDESGRIQTLTVREGDQVELRQLLFTLDTELQDADVAMQEAVAVTSRAWRKANFAELSSGALAPLLPVSTAMGLAAGSDDAEDWKPRFTRATGIEPDARLSGTEFAVQLYRERLVARALR